MPIRTPAGIAITPDGNALVSISSRFEVVKHSGLFRYRAADGKVAPGLNLPYFPGDLDTDAQGLLYLVDKLTEQWHVYTPDGKEISGSPFGRNTGLHVVRGISVTPDGSKVYIISETAHNVRLWQGSATPASAQYQQSGILVDKLSFESSGVDVMNDGTVWVSCHEDGSILAFDAEHRLLGQISGGTPSLSAPQGVAFTPNGNTLWIMSRLGQVQRWERTGPRTE